MKILNKKRISAVIVAAVMFIISLFAYSSNAMATNSSIAYTVCNAQTGAQLRTYTLDPLAEKVNTRSVIGTDERVIDWTKSGVVKIMNSNNYIGTGFVVGDHVIATAAHCVKGLKISEILLFNSDGSVSLHATPVEAHYPTNYSTDNLDYALITVEEDLSDYACFSLGVTLDSIGSSNQAVSVTGFPGDLNNNHTQHTMYTGNGIILSADDEQLFYTADTGGGNSGGPVYVTESRCGYTYFTVIAIHAYLPHGGKEGNRGTRITTDEIHFYMNNPNLNWE